MLEINPPRCLGDPSSANGTFANKKRVDLVYLNDGDLISGGKTRIRVSILADADDPWATVGKSTNQPEQSATPNLLAPMLVPDTSSWSSRTPLLVPSIPGYDVVRELGRGGMGVVYHAKQIATGLNVALKIILPESAASESLMQRFLREVSILSRLSHPRIVRFLEMGMAQGQFYFVMEYVETIDLDAALARQTPSGRIKAISGIIYQVLDGLSYAHEQSFVHRDIKPANILVTRTAKKLRSKLADFGLAKNFEHAGFSGMTREGQTLGTYAYMAPEQVINSRDARPAVDIYSVGATLYRMLSGKLPYDFSRKRDPLVVILEDAPIPLTEQCGASPRA